MKQNRGSVWSKWDLHFHTPSSYDYKGSVGNEEIIEYLAANNVAVVAITDHHLIDVERIRILKKFGISKGITILPGIEFRAELGGSESIHFIAIFPENADLDHIWIKIQSECNLTQKDIEDRGGDEKIICDLKDTCRLIHKLGGITTVHGGSKSNTVESISNGYLYKMAQKTELLLDYIDILELGKESDYDDYKQKVFPAIKRVLPSIICSDNHNIKNYSVRQSLWIKAEPTFEGLRQILYEPDQRVKIQKEEPDYKDEKLVIDSVRFISSDKKFTPDSVYLNGNLNVIIGGKSSGKSILLYSIAKTLLSESDFFERLKIHDKYPFRKEDPSFDFEITTRGGFSQRLYRPESEVSIMPDLKYIPQNYLVELAEPQLNKKGNALNKMVRELIKENSDANAAYESFLSEVKSLDRTRENAIDLIFELQDKIKALENELSKKSSKEVLESNIKSNIAKVEEINKLAGLSQEEIENFKRIQQNANENKALIDQIRSDIGKSKDFNKESREVLASLGVKMDIALQSIRTPVINRLFKDTYTYINSFLNAISDFDAQIDSHRSDYGELTFKKDGLVSDFVKAQLASKEKLELQLKPYFDNQEIGKQRDVILGSIEIDKAALLSIDNLNKELLELRAIFQKKQDELFDMYRTIYSQYLNVISALKSRVEDLEHDGLKITGYAKFNYPKFRNIMIEMSDGRTASYRQYQICNDELDGLDEFLFDERLAEIKSIYEAVMKNQFGLKRIDKKAAVKNLMADYFFDYWEIEYKGDKLGKMSTGKACFVILMLIVGLSKSKGPILIDQPEDNLDNRSITTDLVTYLRNKKLERQIIVVTHNPNIVVNADAENIIVANQKGQSDIETSSPYQFDYINGALENTFPKKTAEPDLLKSMGIREHIAEIVEGGKEAFLKREKKYGFDI